MKEQLWTAFKIWIIAVVINAITGAACLTDMFREKTMVYDVIYFGIFFGLIASFPVFIILFIVINRSVCRQDYGKMIFVKTLVAGIVLSVISYVLFFYWFGSYLAFLSLLFCAIFSGIAAISSQYKYLIRLEQPALSAHH